MQCHGEHTLVEIFQKRNFTCDCGTKRFPATSPCALRTNSETNTKGNVHSEESDANNTYNQNFRNRFCGCECDYDPFQQKGTMFQCLGLGTTGSGGCGEDWYHPGCLVGMGPEWFEKLNRPKNAPANDDVHGNGLETIIEGSEDQQGNAKVDANETAIEDEDDDPPMPPGFPEEDDFEGFLCYKCVESNPWIKQYAGTSGFLPAVFLASQLNSSASNVDEVAEVSKKRKADDDADEQGDAKRVKAEGEPSATEQSTAEVVSGAMSAKLEDKPEESSEVKPEGNSEVTPEENAEVKPEDIVTIPSGCKLPNLAPAPAGRFSLFFKDDFRDKFCRCSECYPKLNAQPQLLEEEEVYEPPISEGGASQHGGSTNGSGSLLERGESALRGMDRVRAIEGVMAYNHLKEQLKPFFQQFAESGKAVGAEDIKAYFAKLRGDEQDIKDAGEAAASSKEGGGDGDTRKEQSGC